MSNQEEDATDLNFPKDAFDVSYLQESSEWSSAMGIYATELRCGNCLELLLAPYIECAACLPIIRLVNKRIKTTPVLVCLSCFVRGVQFDSHKNDHDFVVRRDNISVLDKDWTGCDELNLLDALRICGVGNWDAISNRLNCSKTALECKIHFFQYYVREKKNTVDFAPKEALPYVDSIEDPPRPLFQSPAYYDMAGYNAARADFEIEHDNNAELLLSDIESIYRHEDHDSDAKLYKELVSAVVGCYQSKILERQRRKKVMRMHGLICTKKSFLHFNRSRSYLPMQLVGLYPKLHQLLNFDQLSILIEGFKCETELRERQRTLKLYRHNGLTQICSATVFEELQESRNLQLREKRTMVIGGIARDPTMKKVSLPLNIVGRPGYEKLTEAERHLASEIRLMPRDLIRFKAMLMSACKKHNGLTLAHARVLIKIDVNKTRKIYDLLLSRNEISIK